MICKIPALDHCYGTRDHGHEKIEGNQAELSFKFIEASALLCL